MTSHSQIKSSVCPLDCPDTCSLQVTVANGQVQKIRGSNTNPVTQGSICSKVAKYYPEFLYGPSRIRQPLLRSGEKGSGQFSPISWEEAIEHVYQGLQRAVEQYGPASVLPLNYAGPHGKLAGGSMDVRFFNRLGASDLERGPLCGGVRSLAYRSLFGATSPGMSPLQLVHSDLILIWGTNITACHPHLHRSIRQAQKRGAKLVVVDPRRIPLADEADLYIQIKPGCDVVLAMALGAALMQGRDREPLDKLCLGLDKYLAKAAAFNSEQQLAYSGVSIEQFNQLLALCKACSALAISSGVGLERTRNGGASLRSVYALALFAGQLGKLGHGVIGHYGSVFPGNPALTEIEGPVRPVFNILDVADRLLDGQAEQPIKAVFIYNHNPVATHPQQNRMRQALRQKDLFVVGCDLQMTDSMKYADVILPAASHFEHDEVFSAYGHGYVQRADAAVAPFAQSLPNTEIFRRLAKRFKFLEDEFKESDSELINKAFYNSESLPGTDQVLELQPVEQRWLERGPSTQSGRVELFSELLEKQFSAGLPDFTPLASAQDKQSFTLLSPGSNERSNATFGGQGKSLEQQQLWINPLDAKRLAITDGESVRLYNELGEVVVTAWLTDKVGVGVLSVDKGAWCASSDTGQTVNALIDHQLRTDIGNGAAYYDAQVWLGRLV